MKRIGEVKGMEGNVDTHLKVEVDQKNEKYSLDFQFKGNLKVDDSIANLFIKNKQIQALNKLN